MIGVGNAERKARVRLELTEEGYWKEPVHPFNGPDEDEWILTGWRVRTYSGKVKYRNDSRVGALGWLEENGYSDTGDGVHFNSI